MRNELIESMKDGNIVERVVYWGHIGAIFAGIAAAFCIYPVFIIYAIFS